MSKNENLIVPPPPPQTVNRISETEIGNWSEGSEFRVNLTALNKLLESGYLRKKKNSRASSILFSANIGVECRNKQAVLSSLILTMKYESIKSKKGRSKGKDKAGLVGTWKKEFMVQQEERKSWKGGCKISLDPDEIYDSIFRQLSRNTHISDEDRKTPILFEICYFIRDGETITPKKHVKKLETQSIPFFVCGWRKANKIEKKEKKKRQKMDWKEKIVNKSEFLTLAVNPTFGGVVQPVSVYVMISGGKQKNENNNELLKYIGSGEDRLEDLFMVFFGTEVASVLSVSIETLHPLYNGCLRIICLTPPVRIEGKVKVTVRLKAADQEKVISGEGDFTFIGSTTTTTTTQHENGSNHNQIFSSSPMPPPPPPPTQQQQQQQQHPTIQFQDTNTNFGGDGTENIDLSNASTTSNETLYHIRKKRKLNDGGIENKKGDEDDE